MPDLNLLALLLFFTPWFYLFFLELKKSLHILQLEGYQNSGLFKWLKKNYFDRFSLSYLLPLLAFPIFVLFGSLYPKTITTIFFLTLWVVINFYLIYFRLSHRQEAKKPLVFTPRAKRLFTAAVFAGIAEIILLFLFLYPGAAGFSIIGYRVHYLLAACLLLLPVTPFTLMIANLLVYPLERTINSYYFRKAQKKVRGRKDLIIIGITGSYGKTSTKFITSRILEEKYRVLKTPESYNTPMGISKVINNQLSDEDEVFIVEMGARHPGDIKTLCRLTGPKIGILTSIGPSHLETFGSIENIMKAKYELIESLPDDGLAVFNYDNPYCKQLAEKTKIETALYGFNDQSELQVSNIQVSSTGSSFTLKNRQGEEAECSTVLLGEHNILNILAGATVAARLGLSLKEIARGIEKIEPVPHRLQLINPGTGITVIDDAFNSNPAGARAALQVLGQFRGRKIIVTPGMVELGAEETAANRQLGREIAKVCDYVLLIKEERARPIIQGLEEERFPRERIFVLDSLQEAQKKLQTLLRKGDVVLFENDLPDNY